MKIDIFDTTLRDGFQQEGISPSVKDKLAIAIASFEIGIDIEYINPNLDIHEIIDITLSESEKLNISQKLQKRKIDVEQTVCFCGVYEFEKIL